MKKIATFAVLLSMTASAAAYAWDSNTDRQYRFYRYGAFGPGYYSCGYRGFTGGWGFARCYAGWTGEREQWYRRSRWDWTGK